MNKLLFATLLCLLFSISAQSQQIIRNLGFEKVDSNARIIAWDAGNTLQKYIVTLDTTVAHTGKCAVIIAAPSDTIKNRGIGGVVSIIFSPAFKTGKKVKVSAYIKTHNLTDGVAAIGMRLSGDKESIHELNSNDKTPWGTTDWQKYEIELPLTPEVTSVSFAFNMTGDGKAWVDDFEISVDGRLISE